MRPDKAFAQEHGVPGWLRRYSARYGRGVGAVVREYTKYPNAGTLDNGRDRANKLAGLKLILVDESTPFIRKPIEGLAHAS